MIVGGRERSSAARHRYPDADAATTSAASLTAFGETRTERVSNGHLTDSPAKARGQTPSISNIAFATGTPPLWIIRHIVVTQRGTVPALVQRHTLGTEDKAGQEACPSTVTVFRPSLFAR
jgi:hypothetical protein